MSVEQYPTQTPVHAAACDGLTVLYDGGCPLCRREIGVYQGLASAQPLHFLDVSAERAALPPGASREVYLRRFHVQRADGHMLSGAAAFVALWAALPGWRWLARAASLPGATPLLEVVYRGFLRVRPGLQAVARAFEPLSPEVPADLVADLRSDHAGETGAVWIYHGILCVARDPGVRAFARAHRDTEREHLRRIAALLPWPRRSRLLVPWRAAGFLTGALPALFGPRAVYGTVAAVEIFVDTHYQQQIDRLAGRPAHAALSALLAACQADEQHHRDEALALAPAPMGRLLRAWCAMVGTGSALAVKIARKV